jgi:hypothetical protein
MSKRKKDQGKGGPTAPTQFRLKDDTLAELDLIAAHHTAETGIEHTRADAARLAARREADRIRNQRGDET